MIWAFWGSPLFFCYASLGWSLESWAILQQSHLSRLEKWILIGLQMLIHARKVVPKGHQIILWVLVEELLPCQLGFWSVWFNIRTWYMVDTNFICICAVDVNEVCLPCVVVFLACIFVLTVHPCIYPCDVCHRYMYIYMQASMSPRPRSWGVSQKAHQLRHPKGGVLGEAAGIWWCQGVAQYIHPCLYIIGVCRYKTHGKLVVRMFCIEQHIILTVLCFHLSSNPC